MERLTINRKESKLKGAPEWADMCFTCGTCAGGCPVTGVDGLDPRKAVRMAALGLDQELIDSRFPWVCTLCGRCEYAGRSEATPTMRPGLVCKTGSLRYSRSTESFPFAIS